MLISALLIIDEHPLTEPEQEKDFVIISSKNFSWSQKRRYVSRNRLELFSQWSEDYQKKHLGIGIIPWVQCNHFLRWTSSLKIKQDWGENDGKCWGKKHLTYTEYNDWSSVEFARFPFTRNSKACSYWTLLSTTNSNTTKWWRKKLLVVSRLSNQAEGP